MKNIPDMLAESAARHVRLCPRQVLGVRMGMMAGQVLRLEIPQNSKRLFAFVETDGCAATGISLATGCRVGRRTMRVVDFGKVAATFVDTLTTDAVRIHPHNRCRVRAWEYAPEAQDRWHAQLLAYQTMPDDQLLVVQRVTLAVSLEKILSQPGARAVCGVCGEEIMNQRELIIGRVPVCRACAGEAYYSPLSM